MSDIYLQITETPTVVTLSAPVISGALSSTVTVANTVTVALDSNSLSALENVTVTVGAAVTISNFPATQAVSLASVPTHAVTLTSTTVTVSSMPALSAGTNQIGSVTASLSGWELLGQRDFFANGSTWSFGNSIIGSYSSIALSFGDGNSGSLQAVYLPPDGQENDVYWTSQDGSRVRIVTTGAGLFMATAFPAILNISTLVAPTSTQIAYLYGKKENTLALTNTQLRGSALTVSGTVTIGSALPAGTNRIGVVTIGAGTVTIGAGTAQIGSVTASISGTVPVSGTFWQATQPVSGTFWQATQPASLASLPALSAGTNQIGSVTASISGTVPVSGTFWQTTQPVALSSTTVTVSSLPALVAGTAQIGSVTASISGTVPISISSVTVGNSVTIGSCVTHGVTITNTVVTFFPAQGTSVSATNFTSLTSSTTIAPAVDGREVLTVFNEGAGNLHISPGATCTTVAYQVRLSAGDYWECPAGQLSLAHTAVFATAGTARVTQVS